MFGSVLHYFGIDSVNGPWYAFWSGAGSDLAYLGIFWAIWKHHNCHEPKCWRIGRVTVDDKGTRSCWRHYPDGRPQRGHVRRRYHLYLGGGPGKG